MLMGYTSQIMFLVATHAQNTPPSPEHPCSPGLVRSPACVSCSPSFHSETLSLVAGFSSLVRASPVDDVHRSKVVENEQKGKSYDLSKTFWYPCLREYCLEYSNFIRNFCSMFSVSTLMLNMYLSSLTLLLFCVFSC